MASVAFPTFRTPARGPVPEQLAPIEQRVEVTYHYRVLFTERVFASENPLLAESIASPDNDTPTRFLCVVEDGVARHRPGLLEEIKAYARRYPEVVDLVA